MLNDREWTTCTSCATVQPDLAVQESYDDTQRAEIVQPVKVRRRADAFDMLPLHSMCLPEHLRCAARSIHRQAMSDRACHSLEMAAACLHAAMQHHKIAMRKEDLVRCIPNLNDDSFGRASRKIRANITVLDVSVEDTIQYLAERLPLSRPARYQVAAKAKRSYEELSVRADSKPYTVACIMLARHADCKMVAHNCQISEKKLRSMP